MAKPAEHAPGIVVDLDSRRAGLPLSPEATLETMNGYLTEQLNLCRQLEHIADGLPDNVNSQECLHAARSIFPIVHKAHEFEEHAPSKVKK